MPERFAVVRQAVDTAPNGGDVDSVAGQQQEWQTSNPENQTWRKSDVHVRSTSHGSRRDRLHLA